LFGKTPLKAQNDYIFQKFGGGMAPLAPPGSGYAYAHTTAFKDPVLSFNARHQLLFIASKFAAVSAWQ